MKHNIYENCENCFYSYHNDCYHKFDEYECHRFPPTALMRSDWTVKTAYPIVNIFDWCGEHKEKEVK